MNRENKAIRIVVIDSGISEHKDIIGEINGVDIISSGGKYEVVPTKKIDNIGHGTAISFLISRNVPKAEIVSVRIYDDDHCIPEKLIFALEYIYEFIECDVINISLGVTYCHSLTRLEKCCEKLVNKGIVIVSAFDNNGTISYPAAFDMVIGVDAGFINGSIKDYVYVEHSPINVIGCQREQRLPWLKDKYQIVSGASFIAPYITAHVAKLVSEGYDTLEEILKELRKSAVKVITCTITEKQKMLMLNKAIVFPFNKEIHSLARYRQNAHFQITDFYDVKYIGNVGKKVGTVIECEDLMDFTIKNYTDINWSGDFDTIVLGHVQDLSNLVNFNFMSYFIEHAIKYKKQIICFDSITDCHRENLLKANINYYYPSVLKKDIPTNYFGKLHKIGKPTIAVVGTGPRQGKFTLQMSLKNIFENSGYSVGMLGTEPTSLLLGADEVYPMGYNSAIDVSGVDAIKVIDQMMRRIEMKEPDLIIVGSQSQSVPFTNGSMKYLPLAQHEFLLATAPDVFILCINLGDDIEYIKRTILYLESLLGTKVLALATLPFEHAQKWSVMSNKKIKLSQAETRERMQYVKAATSLDIYNIASDDNVVELAEKIVDYFS